MIREGGAIEEDREPERPARRENVRPQRQPGDGPQPQFPPPRPPVPHGRGPWTRRPRGLKPVDLIHWERYRFGVKTISTHEAQNHLSRYLAATENGEQFVIARGDKPIAILSPVPKAEIRSRPKVGEMLDRPMSIPDSVFAPLTEEELKVWYE